MLGAWGDQALPETAGIRGFLEDFGHDERVPEWVLDTVDLLVEHHSGIEISSVKYRESRNREHNATSVILTNTFLIPSPTFSRPL